MPKKADWLELALLVVLAVFHPQQWLSQTVGPVHDLRQKIAFDTVDAAIHLGLDVTVGRDNTVTAGCDHDPAAGTTEAAWCFVPLEGGGVRVGN